MTLITPEKAQALLATAYQGQRPLRLHHVRFLRHLLRTGHWRQGAEIHCARLGTERFLINGQHTLTALVQEHLAAWLTVVEIDVPTLAAIGVEVIVVETAQGRGILGVVDGMKSQGLEGDAEIQARKQLLRRFGYKL